MRLVSWHELGDQGKPPNEASFHLHIFMNWFIKVELVLTINSILFISIISRPALIMIHISGHLMEQLESL